MLDTALDLIRVHIWLQKLRRTDAFVIAQVAPRQEPRDIVLSLAKRFVLLNMLAANFC